MGVVALFPLGYSFFLSLNRWNPLRAFKGMEFVGLENYLASLKDAAFLNSLEVTLKFVFLVVFLEFFLGLLLAALLYYCSGATEIFRSVYLLPVSVTPVVAALAWRWMYHPRAGIVSFLFSLVGLEPPLFLSDPDLSLVAVILVDVWKHTPFVALVLLAGLLGVPQSTCEAARVDGASESQLFFHIILPQLRPVIVVVLLIRTMDAFKTFDSVWMLTQGGPAETTNLLGILIYKTAFQFFEMGRAASYSWLMLGIIGSIALFYLKISNRRE